MTLSSHETTKLSQNRKLSQIQKKRHDANVMRSDRPPGSVEACQTFGSSPASQSGWSSWASSRSARSSVARTACVVTPGSWSSSLVSKRRSLLAHATHLSRHSCPISSRCPSQRLSKCARSPILFRQRNAGPGSVVITATCWRRSRSNPADSLACSGSEHGTCIALSTSCRPGRLTHKRGDTP